MGWQGWMIPESVSQLLPLLCQSACSEQEKATEVLGKALP